MSRYGDRFSWFPTGVLLHSSLLSCHPHAPDDTGTGIVLCDLGLGLCVLCDLGLVSFAKVLSRELKPKSV
jgi:hypothetical protein